MEKFNVIRNIKDDIVCATVINYVILFKLEAKDKLIRINYFSHKELCIQLLKCLEKKKTCEKNNNFDLSRKKHFEKELCSECSFGLKNGYYYFKNYNCDFELTFGIEKDPFLIEFVKTLALIWPTIIPNYQFHQYFFDKIKKLKEKEFWEKDYKDLQIDLFFLEGHKQFLFYWLSLRFVSKVNYEPEFLQ